MRSERSARLILAGLLVLSIVALYAPALDAAFVYDDQSAILENRSLRSFSPPWAPLRPPAAAAVAGRPALNLGFAASWALSGPDPRGHRAVNVAIHALAACALFGCIRRSLARLEPARGPSRWPWRAERLAFAAALLWALHPVQTHAVTYLSQRAEAQAGLALLVALWASIRGFEGRRAWHGLAVASALVAAGSKETGALAPILVWSWDRLFRAGGLGAALRASPWLYAGLALAPLLTGLLLATGGQPDQALSDAVGPLAYARSEAPVIVHYLRLALLGGPLVFEYAWPLVGWREAAPAVALVLALLAITAFAFRRGAALAYLGVWWFAILAPTSSLLPMRFLAEGYRLYLPLAAVSVGAVLLGAALAGRLARVAGAQLANAAALALVGGVALGLATATLARNRVFASPLLLWGDTVAKRPQNALARNNHGLALLRSGRTEEALAELREAVRLEPDYAAARSSLAAMLHARGELEEAREHYEVALREQPGRPELRVNLGVLLFEAGRVEAAVEQYRTALRIAPELAEAHFNLAQALRRLGRAREAEHHRAEAFRLEPELRRRGGRRPLPAPRPPRPD